jgi:hypothetical protein
MNPSISYKFIIALQYLSTPFYKHYGPVPVTSLLTSTPVKELNNVENRVWITEQHSFFFSTQHLSRFLFRQGYI